MTGYEEIFFKPDDIVDPTDDRTEDEQFFDWTQLECVSSTEEVFPFDDEAPLPLEEQILQSEKPLLSPSDINRIHQGPPDVWNQQF